MVNIADLMLKKVNIFVVKIESEKYFEELISNLTALNIFKNASGFLSRNSYELNSKTIKYIYVDLDKKEISFNRSQPFFNKEDVIFKENEIFIFKCKRNKLKF